MAEIFVNGINYRYGTWNSNDTLVKPGCGDGVSTRLIQYIIERCFFMLGSMRCALLFADITYIRYISSHCEHFHWL